MSSVYKPHGESVKISISKLRTNFQTRSDVLARPDREVLEAVGEGRREGEGDGQRAQGVEESGPSCLYNTIYNKRK